MNKDAPFVDKGMLIEEYLDNKKPMHQIAEEQGIAVGTVYNYIKKYGIQSRPRNNEYGNIKMSLSRLGKPHPRTKPVSEETKRKISLAHRGRFRKPTKYGGHIKIRNDGYNMVRCPFHPNCTKDGYVMEHILVMEEKIGRYLRDDEVVHHKNHIRNDNRIENLQLLTFKEHASLHMKERWAKKKGEII